MAYQNLKAELRRYSVSYAKVAELLGMSINNFSLKANERIPMTVEEAKKIRDAFCPDANLDYLLASDGDVPTKRQRDASQLGAIEDVLDAAGVSQEFYESLNRMRAELGV